MGKDPHSQSVPKDNYKVSGSSWLGDHAPGKQEKGKEA